MGEYMPYWAPTPQYDQHFVEMMKKAENLLGGIEFDTEYIDKVVSENEELLKLDMPGFMDDSIDYDDLPSENFDEKSDSISKIDILMRKSKELLSISPSSGTAPKRLNQTHSVGQISNIIEDDLEMLESKLIAEEQSDMINMSVQSNIRQSIKPIRLGSFSLWEL